MPEGAGHTRDRGFASRSPSRASTGEAGCLRLSPGVGCKAAVPGIFSRNLQIPCNRLAAIPQETGAMNTSTHCPVCRAAIPADAPGGICPSCALLGVARATMVMPPHSIASREEVSAAFPDLEVMEMIGQGGMGVVFKARQPRLDRLVALKILPPHLAAQPGFSERFTREARALAKLHHPHIVTVFDFGESGVFFYLLMEFVNGVNLRKAMQACETGAGDAAGAADL